MCDSGSLEVVSEKFGDFCTSEADLEGALQQSDWFLNSSEIFAHQWHI